MCKLTDKIQDKRYSNLFLGVLFIFTLAFIIYLFHAHNISVKSQQQIKESYNVHLQKADSLYFNLVTYNRNTTLAYQNANNAILADSIIKAALKSTNQLSGAQVESIKLIISTHFHNIELLHKKYGEKLSMDSLRLCTERELLEGQTKAMIDLHLDKIEHEYSNITMWGAILTILFLVFSFYSLYKIDELIKQGQEGVDTINNLIDKGEQSVERFKEEKQKVVDDMRKQLPEMMATIYKDQQQQIEDFKQQVQEQIRNTETYLTTVKVDFKSNSEAIFDDYRKQLSAVTEECKETFESKQKVFDQLIMNAQKILTELEEKKNKKESKNKK